MLKVSNVSKHFGQKQVLTNISFEVDKNCVVGLLGPNGAGKTTLMRIITGYFKPSEGQVWQDKKNIETLGREYKKQIGYLPENNPLYGEMTVAEYLNFIAGIKQVGEIGKEIGRVMKECGLLTVAGQKIETLSKGYKQRVGLAAALLGDPKLLVLDEPTSGLDPNQIIEIRNLIKSLVKNKIIILSTHILPEAREVCDRLLIINRGKIVLDDKTKEIKNLEKKFVELTV